MIFTQAGAESGPIPVRETAHTDRSLLETDDADDKRLAQLEDLPPVPGLVPAGGGLVVGRDGLGNLPRFQGGPGGRSIVHFTLAPRTLCAPSV